MKLAWNRSEDNYTASKNCRYHIEPQWRWGSQRPTHYRVYHSKGTPPNRERVAEAPTMREAKAAAQRHADGFYTPAQRALVSKYSYRARLRASKG